MAWYNPFSWFSRQEKIETAFDKAEDELMTAISIFKEKKRKIDGLILAYGKSKKDIEKRMRTAEISAEYKTLAAAYNKIVSLSDAMVDALKRLGRSDPTLTAAFHADDLVRIEQDVDGIITKLSGMGIDPSGIPKRNQKMIKALLG